MAKAKKTRKPKRLTFKKGHLPPGLSEYRPNPTKTVLAMAVDEPFGVMGGRTLRKGGYLVVFPSGRVAAMTTAKFIDEYEVVPVGESDVN